MAGMQRSALCVAVVLLFVAGAYASFMSVDLGSESVKVMLMEGKTFDIVLNDQSGRKTDNLVGFTDDGERSIGSLSKSLMRKRPARVFSATQELLGKAFGDEQVDSKAQHRQYELFDNEGAYGVRLSANETFRPEEITAMILKAVNAQANAVAKRGKVKDVVLIVPPYLTEHERAAYISAAEIADLNVLSLINEGFAASINYALIRDLGTDVDTNVVFYNLGAAHASATLIAFKTLEDGKKNSTFLNVQTSAVAWDQALGGRDFDYRLLELILARVEETLGSDIFTSDLMRQRVVARLRQEAKKAKEVLSANQQAFVSIESLTPEHDFRTTITRAEFEEACEDLFERALQPIAEVLQKANLTAADVSAIELLGGGTRMPKFQADLMARFEREVLDKHLNGDEAMVYGASYFGATQSISYKVKNPMKPRDTTPFQHGVRFHDLDVPSDTQEGDDESPMEYMTVIRAGTRCDSKKSLKFKQSGPFTCDIVYEQTDALPAGTELLQGSYRIDGFPSNSSTTELVGTPKVQLFFRLNPSGMVEISKAEAEVSTLSYKKVPIITAEVPVVDSDDEPVEDIEAETEPEAEADTEADAEADTEAKPEADAESETGEQGADSDEAEADDTMVDEEGGEAGEPEEPAFEMVPVKKTKHYELTVRKLPNDRQLSSLNIFTGKNVLRRLEREEKERLMNAEARNELESYVYGTREKMYDDAIQESSTSDERESISEQLMDAADWLYDDGEDADTATLKEKLKELQALMAPILLRISEREALPSSKQAIELLEGASVNATDGLSEARQVTEEEVEELLSAIKETVEWFAEKLAIQETLELHEDPVLLSSEVLERVDRHTKQMKKLSRRPKRKAVVEELEVEAEETVEETEEATQDEAQFVFDLFGDDATAEDTEEETEQLLHEAENL